MPKTMFFLPYLTQIILKYTNESSSLKSEKYIKNTKMLMFLLRFKPEFLTQLTAANYEK